MHSKTSSAEIQALPKQNLLALPLAERPREKLLSRGADSCSDEELIAVLLRTGNRKRSVLDLSRLLLSQSGGLLRLQYWRGGELRKLLGDTRAGALLSAFALGKRASEIRVAPGQEFRDSKQVFEMFRYRLAGLRKERFYALYLDNRHRLIHEEMISEGTLTSSLVHPREVLGPALRESAAAFVVLHNHPSGDVRPSDEDRAITLRLQTAGVLLGITLLDHLIISADHYYSFQERSAL